MILLPYEVWWDIPGLEGRYQASSMGNIRSLDRCIIRKDGRRCLVRGKLLKPIITHDGYETVDCENKIMKIHRLVATTFIPNPENLPQINHKDECKTNNQISNLEYCDMSYNLNYGSRVERMAKGKWKRVKQYDVGGRLIQEWDSIKEAAMSLNICRVSISFCCKGKYKTAGGYIWKYCSD